MVVYGLLSQLAQLIEIALLKPSTAKRRMFVHRLCHAGQPTYDDKLCGVHGFILPTHNHTATGTTA